VELNDDQKKWFSEMAGLLEKFIVCYELEDQVLPVWVYEIYEDAHKLIEKK